MNLKIVRRDIVKPSSPTPNHLKVFELSLMEQMSPSMFTPLVFFYLLDEPSRDTQLQYLERLKTSLSETLSHYYPLAGMLRDNKYIDCNDWGVEFVEAHCASPLSSFLTKPSMEGINNLIPIPVLSEESNTKVLMVQASLFSCGGIALGVCLSHKLADVSSLTTFMKSWAAFAMTPPKIKPCPIFNVASIFPTKDNCIGLQDFSSGPAPIVDQSVADHSRTERFVFEPPRLQALQLKASSQSMEHPTRVEVVSGLIWKSLLKAARTTSRCLRPSLLIQSINIRPHINPPLDGSCIGSLGSFFMAHVNEIDQLSHQKLILEIRKAKEGFHRGHAKRLWGNEKSYEMMLEYHNEPVRLATSGGFEFHFISSTCGYRVYEIDFGWGPPAWVSFPCPKMPNIIILGDTGRDKGIEAWVTLKNEEMQLFEQDAELLKYAVVNPPVSKKLSAMPST